MSNAEDQHRGSPSKGLSNLAWIGIGCCVFVLVVAIVAAIAGFYLWNKARDLIDSPALTVARGVILADDEWEEESFDSEAGQITVRNTSTGERGIVDVSKIGDGQLTIRDADSGETFSLDFEQAADGVFRVQSGERAVTVELNQDSGSLRISGGGSEDGSFTLSTGEAGGFEAPEWIPLYPGTALNGGGAIDGQDGRSGGFSLQTDDGPGEVIEFYRRRFKAAGYELNISTTANADGPSGGSVTASRGAQSCSVQAGRDEGKTTIVVTFKE